MRYISVLSMDCALFTRHARKNIYIERAAQAPMYMKLQTSYDSN
jgi:hypothetical protein